MLWKVYMSVVTDLHHFQEKQDPARVRNSITVKGRNPDPHQSEMVESDPHQSERCTNKNPNWKAHQGNGIFSTSADEIHYVHYKQCTKTVYGCFLFI
jgi:hypothetical protein